MVVPANETSEQMGPARLHLAVRLAAVLTAVMVGALPIYVAVGYGLLGMAGIWSAITACVVCWVGTLVALVVAAAARGPNAAILSLVGGMFFRMGLPLVFGLVAEERSGALAEGRILAMVLAYYLLALPTETYLSLKLVSRKSPQPATKAV